LHSDLPFVQCKNKIILSQQYIFPN